MSDPQYVGTFIAAIGSAIMYQSIAGYGILNLIENIIVY